MLNSFKDELSPKKILILNLTRLGDLVQTTPAIDALKKKYPDSPISLLVNKAFLGITKYIPFVDHLFIFDVKRFEPALSGKDISLIEVYRYMESVVDELRMERFDMVINLTHSKLSAMFVSMIDAKSAIGMAATRYGDRQLKGDWINYFCNMVANRRYNRFNLVDIYIRATGCKPDGTTLLLTEDKDISDHTESFIKKNNILPSDIIIGFQPSSSRIDRRWPASSFASLANFIKKDIGAKIVLFGASNEKDIGDEIASLTNNEVINEVGKTDIPRLIGILKRVDILVTADTGTMHVASALGVKVVALFFSHALCFETGPYKEGHIIFQTTLPCTPCSHHIECKNPICRDTIKPADIFEVIKVLSRKGSDAASDIKKVGALFKDVAVMTTVLDKDNMYNCIPLNKITIRENDIVGMAYKEIWKLTLDNNDLEDLKKIDISVIASYVSREIKDNYISEDMREILKRLKDTALSFKSLSEKAGTGIEISKGLLSEYMKPKKNLFKIKGGGEKLTLTDNEIEEIGLTNETTMALIQFFKFGKENLEGDDIGLLAKGTIVLYDRLHYSASVMHDVLINIINNLKKEE